MARRVCLQKGGILNREEMCIHCSDSRLALFQEGQKCDDLHVLKVPRGLIP